MRTLVDENFDIFNKIMNENELQEYIDAPFRSFISEMNVMDNNFVRSVSLGSLTINISFLNLDFLEAFIKRYEKILIPRIKNLESKDYIDVSNMFANSSINFDKIKTKKDVEECLSLSNLLIDMFSQDEMTLVNNGRDLKAFLLESNNEMLPYELMKKYKEEIDFFAYKNTRLREIFDKYVKIEDIEKFLNKRKPETSLMLLLPMMLKNMLSDHKYDNELVKMSYETYFNCRKNENNQENRLRKIFKNIPVRIFEIGFIYDESMYYLKELYYMGNIYNELKREEREYELNNVLGRGDIDLRIKKKV